MDHGKLTKVLELDKTLNNERAEKKSTLWFEDDGKHLNIIKIKELELLMLVRKIKIDYGDIF